MPSKPPKSPLSPTFIFSEYQAPLWDLCKERIEELFENYELKDVMRIVKQEYGFNATETQYKKQINKWGLTKGDSGEGVSRDKLYSKRKREGEGYNEHTTGLGQQDEEDIAMDDNLRMTKSGRSSGSDGSSDVVTLQSTNIISSRSPNGTNSPVAQALPQQATPKPFSPAHTNSKSSFFQTVLGPNSSQSQPDSPCRNFSQLSTSTHRYSFKPAPPAPASSPPSILPARPQPIHASSLLNSLRAFALHPTTSSDQTSLELMLSCSQLHYDAFCSQCPLFGYDPAITNNGCTIHRCLSRILAQYKLDKLSIEKAEMLTRGAIAVLLPQGGGPGQEATKKGVSLPLVSLLRILVDVVWICICTRRSHEAETLVQILGIPRKWVADDREGDKPIVSYRTLLAQCAWILAGQESGAHIHEALRTLKYELGDHYADTSRVPSGYSPAEADIFTLEDAVLQLTNSAVFVSDNGGSGPCAFFERGVSWANAAATARRPWYKARDGSLKQEELLVSAIALRAVVEVERWQKVQRRRAS